MPRKVPQLVLMSSNLPELTREAWPAGSAATERTFAGRSVEDLRALQSRLSQRAHVRSFFGAQEAVIEKGTRPPGQRLYPTAALRHSSARNLSFPAR